MRQPAPAVLFAAVVAAAGLPPAAASAHELFVAAPLGGHRARLGAEVVTGARLAQVDVNAAGGVLARELDLTFIDDRCDGEEGEAAAKRIRAAANAPVVGHPCANAALAAAPVYAQSDRIFLAAGVVHPRLTGPRAGAGLFRILPPAGDASRFAAEAIANLLRDAPGPLALVSDLALESRQSSAGLAAALGRLAIAPALVAAVPAGETSYDELAERIARLAPSVVVLALYADEAAIMAGALRRRGVAARLVGFERLAGEEYWARAGVAGEGTLVVAAPAVALPPGHAGLAARLADLALAPTPTALAAYTAVRMWADAANAVGSTDPIAVRAYLQAREHKGPLGTFRFEASGDPTLPRFALHEWRSGKLEPFAPP